MEKIQYEEIFTNFPTINNYYCILNHNLYYSLFKFNPTGATKLVNRPSPLAALAPILAGPPTKSKKKPAWHRAAHTGLFGVRGPRVALPAAWAQSRACAAVKAPLAAWDLRAETRRR